MDRKNIVYQHINLGPKIRNNLEYHNFAFNHLKVSQIDSHQNLNICCQNNDNKGKINIITNGYHRDSINIISPKGGIELSCPENILNFKSNKIFYLSKDINILSSNLCFIKTKTFKIEANVLLLNSFENIEVSSGIGKLKFSSNHSDKDSILLKSLKGGIELFSNAKIEILSSNNLNLSCFGDNSEINIGTTNKNTQVINIGNNKSTISVNNDIFIKGNIISTDTKIEKITTCLSETSESILLLSKDNIYGSKNMGFVSRNINKYIGFLFDSQKNQFYMSDNVQFAKSSGITGVLSFGKLKIGELDINGKTLINKFGNLTCSSIKSSNFTLEQTGDIHSNGSLNVNNKFKINSVNGNCSIDGQLIINGLNINNIYKYQIGENFYYQTIQKCLETILNKKNYKNNFERTIYLSPQEYEENITIKNNFVCVEGNNSTLKGIINIYNGDSDLNLDTQKSLFLSDFFFIKDLNIITKQEDDYLFNFDIEKAVQYTITNVNIYISDNVDKLFNLNINNGTFILDNVNIYCHLDFNIRYLFNIDKVNKLIIKNSSLTGRILFKENSNNNNVQIIITNCIINAKIDPMNNFILRDNIIENSDETKLLLDRQNKFI